MPELFLVCEAPADPDVDPSHEKRVLAALLNPRSTEGPDIQIEGSGGGKGTGAVANYISNRRPQKVTAARVRDRDYRPLAWAETSLTDGKGRFLWRRHEFENYLLQPEVVAAAMRELSGSFAQGPAGRPAWADRLPMTVDVVTEHLVQCAQERAAVEAYAMVAWAIQSEISPTDRRQLAASPPAPSGGPPDAEACVARLRAECVRVAVEAQGLARCDTLDAGRAEDRYRQTLSAITSPGYLAGGTFLRDFGGTELLKRFHQRLRQTCGVAISRSRLERELADAIIREYRPGLFEPDDFRHLADGVRALAGLGPGGGG